MNITLFNIKKQIQFELNKLGSFTFFEKDPENIPEPDEPSHSIDLPKALA